MPASAPDVNSRNQLLAGAAKLFRNQGYASTTLRGIAAFAGVTAGSIYYHFASKEEIVIEVLNLGVQAVHAEVMGVVSDLPPQATGRQILEAAVGAHLRSLLELQDYTSANTRIFGQVEPHVRERTMKVRRAYEDYWGVLLGRAVGLGAIGADVDIPVLRLLLFGAMNGALEWYRPHGLHTIDQIAVTWVGIVLDGASRSSATGR